MTSLQLQGYTDLSHVAKLAGGPAKYMKEHDFGILGCKIGGVVIAALSIFLIAETVKLKRHKKIIEEYIELEDKSEEK